MRLKRREIQVITEGSLRNEGPPPPQHLTQRLASRRGLGITYGTSDNSREGNGAPLQYPCLENPMDGGAWGAAVRGVAEGRTRPQQQRQQRQQRQRYDTERDPARIWQDNRACHAAAETAFSFKK